MNLSYRFRVHAIVVAALISVMGLAQVQAADKTLRVGVRGGTDEQIWEVVTKVAKKNGLNVEAVVISGAASPNEALNNGDLDANSFQHIPFLRDQIKQRGYKLSVVGNTYISPIAFYSKKYKSIKDLPDGAKVAIPNDPSNQTRALVVLRDAGLITLRDGFDPFTGTVSLNDITAYKKKISLTEAASVVLARSLEDVDTAAIVNTFAYQAGLIATRDGIAVEKRENNPYVNIIVVREQDKNAAWVAPLVKAYQSEEVRQFIQKQYGGSVVPVF
ncbi:MULTISPECIES: MetQ/NlpA family ABC transporter substrate-binding protein [unclassified Herbaspirillum]|uniref:MetQ/NlpA family ABC transporter substrate-binding protein n=1 Tax=unclassified Herbaspirillum TaxID=2624150 RepID=UPI000E2F99FD|nr:MULTISPECIES: MetQ/NlpA family ABC transporter substrate-binding protein [unclassified Herbaspirillum]RFB67087.1 MetQ/NlpA family ABC transporter substrate-binding protein [Herbaspirillum sp. 3R-3a1]TFI06128.1 MetQ/NlpA family ABC transporter substrate-binding protein [Herbaspirillum sp. 3R11]TFI14260.1 MetQ/NlpA family ABC transporter substrate-binding protein [Herbaspirillum sp. 3R-11]TFI30381.1 MetQ/NlpA family ABC transporter substrate-binding protein [Herbaspirillum sp. 3C11]